MKKRKILTGGIIIAVIMSISILAIIQNFQKNTPPIILDGPEIEEAVNVNLGSNVDSPGLNDSSTQEQNFWTDEEGKKHYTIKVGDSPQLED